jgi:hypothetical protein
VEYEDNESLLEDDENADDAPVSVAGTIPGNRDPRRLIERRLELQRLREQLEDPGFYYDFE